jgi:PAB-dependent poly(A)-specific ribonuclease subunit 2
MSPSGETMVFGDMLGQIHHFADREQFKINNSARLSLEVVDPHPAPPAHRLNEMSSLATPSAFTFPYMLNATATLTNSGNFPGAKAKPSLLSDWPNDLMFPVSRPPEPIDPTLLKSMRQVDFVGIIPHMPGTKLRNQTKRLPPSKFEYHSLLLEAVKEADAAESFIPPSPDKPLTKSLRTRAPRNYRRIPIKASKLGFEDFDFKPFNKTGLSGIENILSNSYVNPILQMLYNIPQLRVAAQNHLCTADHCLMCELGFLFHMLDLSTGDSPCQTKNFLRTLREIPQALRLGLFEEDNPSAAIPKLIERFTVFLLQQLNKDSCHPPLISSTPGKPSKPLSTSESYIDKLFGSSVRITNHCQTCDQHTTIDNRALFHPLRIPLDNDDGESTTHSFAGLLKQALTNDEPTQSWCENCKTFQPSQHFKETTALPVVLCLQPTAIDPSLSFWANVTDSTFPIAYQSQPTEYSY